MFSAIQPLGTCSRPNPELADRVAYRPHGMIARIPRVHAAGQGASGAGTVAVLGNLNRQKGAGVLGLPRRRDRAARRRGRGLC